MKLRGEPGNGNRKLMEDFLTNTMMKKRLTKTGISSLRILANTS